MAQKFQVTEGQLDTHAKDLRELPSGETDQERMYRLLWHGSRPPAAMYDNRHAVGMGSHASDKARPSGGGVW